MNSFLSLRPCCIIGELYTLRVNPEDTNENTTEENEVLKVPLVGKLWSILLGLGEDHRVKQEPDEEYEAGHFDDFLFQGREE